VYHSPNMKAGIALVLLTLAAPLPLHAQVTSTELSAALSTIRNEVDRWENANYATQPPAVLRDRWARARKAAEWLIGRANATNPTDVTPEYLRSLQRVAELATKGSDSEWEDVASELEAKVDHCRKLGIGMGGTVTLRVNTLRAGKPVPNLRVQALLKISERVTNAAPRNSARVSSPADVTLEPGRYWLWAVDETTGAKSQRVLASVTGQKELLFDLTIP
jgi:hypothetical protein